MKTTILTRTLRIIPLVLGLAAAPLAAHAQSQMQTGPEVTLGPLVIAGGFSRATLPNAPVGGGFMTITNTGDQDDTLVAASSAVAGRVEIHEMKMQGDVMEMRHLEGGLPIPARQTVTLKPGGYHLMFMGLQQPLVQGTRISVTLTFAKAGTVDVPLVVGPINAGAMHMQNGGTMQDSTGGNRIDNGMTHEKMPGMDTSAPASMG